MRKEVPYLACDMCDTDELRDPGAGLRTHRLAFDGVSMEADLCSPCTDKLVGSFARFASVARRVPTRTRVADAVPFPGTGWRFSSHALTRLGERRLDPILVIGACDEPTTTRPGRASDLEIRQRGKVKAVVAPSRGIIVTVAHADEDDPEIPAGRMAASLG